MAEAENIPTTPGGWQTLIIDPPWRFANTAARGAIDYESMSDDEILRMPIALIAAPKAHLYLWTTDVHLDLALRCMREWGFTFVHPFVWVKTASDGGLRIGNGNYGRKAHELLLFGTRGGLKVQRHNVPTVFFAPPRRPHSRKPITAHEFAELLSPGPRLEMFSRRARPGWVGWGKEYPRPEGTEEPTPHVSARARFMQWFERQVFDLRRSPTEQECRVTRERYEAEERAELRRGEPLLRVVGGTAVAAAPMGATEEGVSDEG